jgi:hypothetical protein
MKKIIITVLAALSIQIAYAQSYSGWISASKNPTLQMRWATQKDANNYSYLMLQFISSVGCKFNVTATLCDKDGKSVNGWKPVRLIKNKQATCSFKIMNSCTNGFWWWYKDYATTAVKFDDN